MQISKAALAVISATILGAGVLGGCTSSPSNTKQHSSTYPSKQDTHASADHVALHTIYFDFDRYNIRSDQTTLADEMAHSLKSHSNLRVEIQGNTDDRGSVEYNMALGTRRAESLKNYLITSGVSPDNIETVSYGKERPAVHGSNEYAWEQNRRDDVVVVGD